MSLRDIQLSLFEYLNKEGGVRKNVNPRIWGSSGWKFLDKVADSYPIAPTHNDKVQMINFLTSLGYALPCEKCRVNYIQFSMDYPPVNYVTSKRRVKQWFRLYKNRQKLKKG